MRRISHLLGVIATIGCAAMSRSSSPGPAFATPAAALDCAEDVLEHAGFQVQGDDVGAASYQRMVPGRRATDLLARQRNGVTGEIGYVRVEVIHADSAASYRLRANGVTTSADGTDKPSLLHEQGVGAVVAKCGATRG